MKNKYDNPCYLYENTTRVYSTEIVNVENGIDAICQVNLISYADSLPINGAIINLTYSNNEKDTLLSDINGSITFKLPENKFTIFVQKPNFQLLEINVAPKSNQEDHFFKAILAPECSDYKKPLFRRLNKTATNSR